MKFVSLCVSALLAGCSIPSEQANVDQVDYLVISPTKLADAASRYADYRQTTGFTTEVVIWNDLEGDNPQQLIRDRIQESYDVRDTERPFYVFLVGDASLKDGSPSENGDELPVVQVYPEVSKLVSFLGFESNISSDNFYADMDGDEVPDFAIGRFPAHTDAELDDFLERVISYENDIQPGEWNKRVMMFASTAGFNSAIDEMILTSAFKIAENMSYDFDIKVTEGRQASPYVYVPEQLSDKIYEQLNEGSLLSIYAGHGSTNALPDLEWNDGQYPILNLDSLEEDLAIRNRSPIVSLVACSTGNFTSAGESLAERMMMDSEGPIALMASTTYSHPYNNTMFTLELGNAMLNDRHPTIGQVFLHTKRNSQSGSGEVHQYVEDVSALFVPASEKTELWRIHQHMYELFGDPATSIAYPDLLEIDAPTIATTGETIQVEISAPTLTSGTLTLSLESDRSEIPWELSDVPEDGDLQRNAIISENYELANDKVLWSTQVEWSQDRPTVQVEVPADLSGFQTVMKAYLRSDEGDATGSLRIGLQ